MQDQIDKLYFNIEMCFFFCSLYLLVDEDIYSEDALILKQDLSWWVSEHEHPAISRFSEI